MPLTISKDCFPTPTRCYNCERKANSHVKDSGPNAEYKRCGGCHLLTYCDKDCQREHWLRVHKSHCRFLSGKVLVSNSDHIAATCTKCIDQRQTSLVQIKSENSPSTTCNIDALAAHMKTIISKAFDFHKEGKKCHCKEEFALKLPFALGEVVGHYIGSDGLDALLAHSLKILHAMFIKERSDERKTILSLLYSKIVCERSKVWFDILTRGTSMYRERDYLSDKVDSLLTKFGASNPWWKALKFSVNLIESTDMSLHSNFEDSQSLENPRFQQLKQIHDYRQSQLQNEALMCEKKMWPNYMLWPQLVGSSLAIQLPPGTRCHSCNAQLSGEVGISPEELNWKDLPCLFPIVSDSGALMVSCPVNKNPSCVANCQSKNVEFQLQVNEAKLKEYGEEADMFVIEGRWCDFCIKSSLSSHRCSACLSVQYCSLVCQKKDLEFHKSVCDTWAKDKSKKISGRGTQKNYNKSVVDGKWEMLEKMNLF